MARRPDKSASAFDKFPWVKEGRGGQAKATTLLGFVKDLFRQGGVVCAGLVKDSEESPIMKNFLDHLSGFLKVTWPGIAKTWISEKIIFFRERTSRWS